MKDFIRETLWRSLIFGVCFVLIMLVAGKLQTGPGLAPAWVQMGRYFLVGFGVNFFIRLMAWMLLGKRR